MGYSITEEHSLARWLGQLTRENTILATVMKIELAVATLLIIGGGMYYFTAGSPTLLWIGGALAVIATGHWWKQYENDTTASHVERGRAGELRITHLLEKHTQDSALIINDVTLRFGRTKAQIDHIVIAENGIFVIETKNWAGTLHGTENDDHWVQVKQDKKGNEIEVHLGNPIVQNERHCAVVRDILAARNTSWNDVISIIIIVRRTTGIDVRSTTPVIHPNDIADCIQRHPSSKKYSMDEMRAAVDALLPGGWRRVTEPDEKEENFNR